MVIYWSIIYDTHPKIRLINELLGLTVTNQRKSLRCSIETKLDLFLNWCSILHRSNFNKHGDFNQSPTWRPPGLARNCRTNPLGYTWRYDYIRHRFYEVNFCGFWNLRIKPFHLFEQPKFTLLFCDCTCMTTTQRIRSCPWAAAAALRWRPLMKANAAAVQCDEMQCVWFVWRRCLVSKSLSHNAWCRHLNGKQVFKIVQYSTCIHGNFWYSTSCSLHCLHFSFLFFIIFFNILFNNNRFSISLEFRNLKKWF